TAHNALRLMSGSPMSTPRNLPSPAGGRPKDNLRMRSGGEEKKSTGNTFPLREKSRLGQAFPIPSPGLLRLENTIGISFAPIAAVAFGRVAKEGWLNAENPVGASL